MKHTPYTANLSSEAERPPDWRSKGRCFSHPDPERWFPEQGQSSRRAKQACNGTDNTPECPIRHECLIYALVNNEKYGVWGGTSERERRALRKWLGLTGQPPPFKRQVGPRGMTSSRTYRPAAPLRQYLLSLVGTRFPSKHQLSVYVSEHSGLYQKSVVNFLGNKPERVILEWATVVCQALGLPELPAQLWPEVVAA